MKVEQKKCLRCNKEFDNPVPEVTNVSPHAITEIATEDWCSDCNRLTMNLMFREATAYKVRLLGNTMIAVDLSASAYKARSPKREKRKELEVFMKEAEELALKYPGLI